MAVLVHILATEVVFEEKNDGIVFVSNLANFRNDRCDCMSIPVTTAERNKM